MPHDTTPHAQPINNLDDYIKPHSHNTLSLFSAAKESITGSLRQVASKATASTAAVLSTLSIGVFGSLAPQAAEAQTYTVSSYGGGTYAYSINNNAQAVGSDYQYAHAFLYTTTAGPTDLGMLNGYNGQRAATGINDSGQIVGWSIIDFNSDKHPFIYQNGAMSDLGTVKNCLNQIPASYTGVAFAINNSGQAVGWTYYPAQGTCAALPQQAFIYSAGTMTTLGTGTGSYATAISSNGKVAGYFPGTGRSFYYSNGTSVDIGTLGGSSSYAYGVNSSGQVVGQSTTASGAQHAFLYSNGTMTDLGTLGGSISVALGINDNGQIVGYATTATNLTDGFVYSNGVMTNLVTATGNANIAYAYGINSIGQIVAVNGAGSAYLLSPNAQQAATPTKTLGNPNAGKPEGCDCEPNKVGQDGAGDPISVGTGNLFEKIVDYTAAGPNPLTLVRYYNSLSTTVGTPANSNLGVNWRTNYDRTLSFTPATGTPTSIQAFRPDGQGLTFTVSGSTWVSDTDVDYSLTQNGTTWILKGPDDTTETYNAAGKVTTIVLRNGYTQNVAYGTGGNLSTVTDSYSRTLTFTPNSNGLIQSVSTPDAETFTYGYTIGSGTTANRLATVTYSTSPTTSQTYLYGNTSFPFAMTGIMDEDNVQYATWTFDSAGRGKTSQHGAGADLTTFTFNSNGSTTVTNAYGVADTYTFSTLQGVPKVTGISRAATSTTAAATKTFGYDSNGYMNSETDWNGNKTTYVNNAQGNPTTINYAVGSAVAYSKTISYDPTFIRLPHQIVTPGLTSTFAYDTSGNPLTRTDLDTTTNTIPYSTGGQSRVTTYTWSATGQETSITLPRTDVTAKTTFGYDTTGALTSITDALSHQTKITSHTGGGYPLTVVDPNNVTSTMTYDARLNLHTQTIDTAGGNYTTTWNTDHAQYLDSLVKPDGSTLTFGHDTAHRLTSITDLLSNSITYTLDALGDKTLVQLKNNTNLVTASHSADFDALGRITSDIGGMNQTTTFTYDPQGNNLTITPPSPSGEITQTFDALNRLSTRVDPTPGGTTTFGYDAHNRILSVADANSHTTANVYDGFGERTQTASPDSGTTVYHYDLDSNLSQEVLPGSLTATYTYDALDRTKTVKYTGDSTLNVTNTYDQTGHGFGVGHLTSSTDQIGSLSLTYDERGNRTIETRTPSGVSAFTTTYGYDAASNIASITYPSTTLVQYGRDTMGKVTSVTAKPPGASVASNIAYSIGYEPFGPISSVTYGNGIAGTYGYDLDYRATTRLDKGSATISSLSYGYFSNNSVQTIADSVHAANTQTLGYDSMDHLITATSGTGGYGTLGFTWDGVSNLKTQTINGTATTFNYVTGTNQLSTLVTGSSTETVATTTEGNISSLKVGSTTIQAFTYNKANELASASNGSSSATYEYDLLGRRTRGVGTVSGTAFYEYDTHNNLLENRDNTGVTRADYVYINPQSGPGATLIGTYQPNTSKLYYVHSDRLGTPQSVTDSTATVQWTTTYQPFGKTGTITGSVVQQIRLPGQEYDADSGLNHNGFRDYATSLTRYIQTDPIGLGGGMNTYQYAGGNPFKNIDPRGLGPEELLLPEIACAINPICRAIAGALIQRAATALTYRAAVVVAASPLYIAATDETNVAGYLAAGFTYGACKAALPEGTITPGIFLPEIGSPAASSGGELVMSAVEQLMDKTDGLSPDRPAKYTPIPPSQGKRY